MFFVKEKHKAQNISSCFHFLFRREKLIKIDRIVKIVYFLMAIRL